MTTFRAKLELYMIFRGPSDPEYTVNLFGQLIHCFLAVNCRIDVEKTEAGLSPKSGNPLKNRAHTAC